MTWFLFGIAIVWIMFGTLMLFATQVVRENCYNKLKSWDPRMLSPMPIIGGVLLLLSASSSSQVTFIVILGLLSLLKGIVFLFAPRQKVRRLTDWWLGGSNRTHKAWGVLVIALGVSVLATLVTAIH
ncbi:MAG: hypothetical protein KAT27_05645 [Desulfobacterales bacterium]|nr:hypothetical protein [Desulfobacterales bacterium]